MAAAPRRAGRQKLWTDERIEEKLREIVEEIGELPSMVELDRRGLGGMRHAIGRRGMAFYAGRVGLPGEAPAAATPRSEPRRQTKERRTPRKWTDERIESELRRLAAANGGRFPQRAEFESQGLQGLRRAIERQGIRAWAETLGLKLHPGQDREPYGIEDARRDIDRVVAEAGRLPGKKTLRKLGYGRLVTYASTYGGTMATFCAIHRIELPA